MKKYIPIFLFLIIALTACQPDPRKEADAYATRVQADQDALNQQQNREHAEQQHSIFLQELTVEQGHREATKQEWRKGLNTMIRWGFIFATFTVCLGLVAFGIAFSWSSVGVAKATAQGAMLKANLIYMDKVTRTFPLLQHVHGTKFALHNPNTDGVRMLDIDHDPDRQLIANLGSVQVVGLVADAARTSNDPAGVAIIQPPTINVTQEMITLAKELRNNDE
jgi:hypothetical protein